MKKIVTSILLGTTSLMAMYAEQASLYKDPSVMAMGGVNVAVGGNSAAMFSNPAALSNIKKDDGFLVDVLNIGFSATQKMNDFINDINDAGDADDETTAMSDVLNKYSGEHFHTDVSAYTSLSKNDEEYAWSIALFSAVDINLMAHGNGSSNAELLETTSRIYGGVSVGASKPYTTNYGEIDVGMSMKFITQKSYEGTIGISELIEDDSSDGLVDNYEKTNSGIGVDIGLLYKPINMLQSLQPYHPQFGVSIMNIGSINMNNQYGGQPTIVNIGASISPEVRYLKSFLFGIDYVDLFNANKLRIYDLKNPDGSVAYTDYDTYDFMKKFRMGTKAGLIDSTYFASSVSLGLYDGAYTAGIDMRITVLHLNFSTYEENIGDSTTTITDRRYMAQIAISW